MTIKLVRAKSEMEIITKEINISIKVNPFDFLFKFKTAPLWSSLCIKSWIGHGIKIKKPMVNINHGPWTIPLLRQPGHPDYSGPVAFPTCSISGTRGLPPIRASRRPTITCGLALSGFLFENKQNQCHIFYLSNHLILLTFLQVICLLI
jgi:hypothetical protein